MVSHDIHLVYRYATRVLCINNTLFCQGSPQAIANDSSFLKLFGGYLIPYEHELASLIIEAFSYPFFVRAPAIGSLISVASSILGIYVVLRKESLMGHTISDVSFFGIAIGLVLGLNLNSVTITQ